MLKQSLEGMESDGHIIYLFHSANETWMVLYMLSRRRTKGDEAIEYNRTC